MTRARTSIDIVIPSIRFDMERMLDALQMDIPPGVDISYYVISDNRNLASKDFEYMGLPARLIVNEGGLGAPLSRNVGLDVSMGEYVLFLDDDVVVPHDILATYVAAILEHPGTPGFVGPTIFPEAMNRFTRGIRTSDILTFFDLPRTWQEMHWGTTSNIMVRRDAVGDIRFRDSFPKHGGGEDIDFCLRIVERAGRPFKTVPGTAVNHGWWGGGRRSYRRFFRWAFGDSALPRLHRRYAYRSPPNLIEALLLGVPVLAGLAATGLLPAVTTAAWAGLAILSEFAVERWRNRILHPESTVSDSLESAAVRLSNDMGRVAGILHRGELGLLLARFDYSCVGKFARFENKVSRLRFALHIVAVPISYGLGILWV